MYLRPLSLEYLHYCMYTGFPDGGDYSFDNRQVLLSANITTVCFPPGVLDDDLVENTENYRLVLNNSDNVILMGQETTILIQDNGEFTITIVVHVYNYKHRFATSACGMVLSLFNVGIVYFCISIN